ncbi:MAG TPA: hypothetical protein VNH11_25895 [Pirellulales bacterium]|nr:hypothetical protein [Pirellulales bacterium]
MMTALRISNIGRRSAEPLRPLRTSTFECVASWLLACLLLVGAVTFCLLVVWLGMRGPFSIFKSVSVKPMQVSGGGESDLGDELLLASPVANDLAAETDLTDPEFQSTLTTVIDAAAMHEAAFGDATSFDEALSGSGPSGTGTAAGPGDDSGKPGIPPHLRWEIDFGSADTLDTYARKLDGFGIELATFGVRGPGQLTYIKNLSRPAPDVRVGAAGAEKRLYMSWRRGTLQEADRKLAAKAGVPAGRILLQFYPAETEQLLLRAEHDFRGRDASTIRKTRFGVRPADRGYEFFVVDQQYL